VVGRSHRKCSSPLSIQPARSRLTEAMFRRISDWDSSKLKNRPGIIVLDHGLSGQLTGLDAAPRLKELAPQAKIIMFTAHADLKARADNEPAVDGFVLKTESTQLLPLAQRLTGLGARPTRRPRVLIGRAGFHGAQGVR